MQTHPLNKKPGYMREMWQGDFLFEQYPDAILIVNEIGKIEDANRKLLEMLGYEKSELIGKTMEVLMPKRFRANHVGIRKEHMKHHSGRGIETGMKFEAQRKDGSSFDIDIMLAPMATKNGKITVCVIRDITEKKAAAERERKAKETLKAVVDSAPVAIFVLDKDKIVLSWSREAENLFGYSAEEVVGESYKLDLDEKNNTSCTSLLSRVFSGEILHDIQRKRVHKDGRLLNVSLSAAPMYDDENNIYAAAYCAQDISERLKAEEKLNYLAYFDKVTGLPNRTHLQKDIEEHLKIDKNKPLAIVAVELDGMSEINNTLGQSAGENVFKEITKRLADIPQNIAKIYRSCDSEIFIKIPIKENPYIVIDILDGILTKLSAPFNIDNQIAHIKANAGICIAPMHGKNVEDLLANTHLALRVASDDKSKNYHLFEMSLRNKALEKRNLDLELRKAFENNEFEIFYQPQIRLSNSELVGAEALLRWHHPKKGLISPIGFIDALAKKPIAKDVGKWIMKTAAQQAVKWRKNGFPNFRIGVNLFEAQFDAKTIENEVEDILKETGLPHNALELEITENISHGNDDDIIKPLNSLKNKGVHIAFDDFGTGYASLSYLVKYPLTRIKVDKSFLENIPYSEEDSAIVHSTIVMAHSLGLDVIAEGIETHEHVLFLNGEKCEEGQGYYYSKPMPAKDFFEYAQSTINNSDSRRICCAVG